MEEIILGILYNKSSTIYELKLKIESDFSLIYSPSFGSIQSCLKKLLSAKYILYVEKIENGKYKKIYQITNSGKQYFLKWLNTPSEGGVSSLKDLARYYFWDLTNPQNQVAIITAKIDALKEEYQALKKEIDYSMNLKDECSVNYLRQYRLELLKFNIRWNRRLLRNNSK